MAILFYSFKWDSRVAYPKSEKLHANYHSVQIQQLPAEVGPTLGN